MATHNLESVARALVADGKGILAADETIPTLTRRFDSLGIKSTEQSRRTYREMLFISPGAAEFISGVIMDDETIRQKSSGGAPLAEALTAQGILPGIKVDTGAKPLAGSLDETVTEGLDGLRDRLSEYRTMGARFAKWRAVIRVTDSLPSSACVSANAHALARYAALCQERELVPIVEPEVLMDGSHTIERCDEVTGSVLHVVFNALFDQGVALEGMLLKPNMVVAGKACSRQPAVEEVARATLRCLRRHVPAAVRYRVPVGRPKCAPRDCTSERNQPAARPEALENQFLLRPSASGSGARGLAWPRRESGSRPNGALPPS
jgi:fructose-bisphosphate aldolase, class I